MEDRLLDVEKKVAAQEVLVSRFDSALDKISEVSLNVSKLLAVHEQRIEAQEETTRRIAEQTENRRKEVVDAQDALHSKVNSVEQRLRTEMADGQKEILSEIKSLRTDMNDLGDDLKEQNESAKEELSAEIDNKIDKVTVRVSTLERIQWIAIGGATVIGFLLSQALGLFELLK
jgi:hypothetical protein